jgi:hypothetical protein
MDHSNMASPELRRDHSKALQMRDRWRVRYAAVSRAIRATKGRIDGANHRHEFDREADVTLFALRQHADELMMERYAIKMLLRATAYKFVDKVAA